LRAAEKPDCSTCQKTWALYGKEPDCSICIVPLRSDNQESIAVYNTTAAVKNLGLEPIFEVMRMLKIKDKVSAISDAIKLAAKFKEKEKEKMGHKKNG